MSHFRTVRGDPRSTLTLTVTLRGAQMAQINLLKPRQVSTLPVDFHSEGSNLYLRVTSKTARSWVFHNMAGRKVRQLGLGTIVERDITAARALAQPIRKAVRDELDPAELLNKRDPETMTFKGYAEELIEAKRPHFKSEKHCKQWGATLEAYVYGVIGDKLAGDITLAHIEDILRPMWAAKTETAARVRARIEAVIDYAYVAEGIDKRNPAAYRGNLEHRGFEKRRRIAPVEHHPAAPYTDMPAIMS